MTARFKFRKPDADRLMRAVVLVSLLCASAAVWWPAHAARVKELGSVQGVRANQLTGFGLVFGLDGTGDQATQALSQPIQQLHFLQQLFLNGKKILLT